VWQQVEIKDSIGLIFIGTDVSLIKKGILSAITRMTDRLKYVMEAFFFFFFFIGGLS
jgi:hypothetical protein